MADQSDVFVVSMDSPQQPATRVDHRNGASDPASTHDNPDVAFLLGVLALRDGRHEEAIGLLQRAVAPGPPKPEYHHSLGDAYRAGGQLDRAEGFYRDALRLRPDFAEVHNVLGNLHAERGDFDAAVSCLRRAVDQARIR